MNLNFNNCTADKIFHLHSFLMPAHSKPMIFTLIFLIYSITVLGNVFIISLICLISQFHTPMYFFLCNLSIQDIIYVSDTLPKLLAITKSGDDRITFQVCISQLFILVFCVGTEFLLLTSMAYDRYIAVCIPLHYAIIMKKLICILLAAVSWFVGLVNALTQSLILSHAEFCNSNDINHFYCDLKIMIKLASSDTTIIQTYMSVIVAVMGFVPFSLILTSNICIIHTIAKIRSSGGRIKAFSSCSSHLTVVLLFYGGALATYTIPKSEHSQEQEKLISLLYTALVPLLNPLVYTLRNKDVIMTIKHVKEKYLRSRSFRLNKFTIEK